MPKYKVNVYSRMAAGHRRPTVTTEGVFFTRILFHTVPKFRDIQEGLSFSVNNILQSLPSNYLKDFSHFNIFKFQLTMLMRKYINGKTPDDETAYQWTFRLQGQGFWSGYWYWRQKVCFVIINQKFFMLNSSKF